MLVKDYQKVQLKGSVINLSKKHFNINLLGDDYVVGDIHGCLVSLQQQLYHIGFNPKVDRLFCTGDLVDRGDDSIGVIKLLEKPWFHSVLGNHEYMITQYKHNNHIAEILIANGGYWFAVLDSVKQDYIVNLIQTKMPLIIEIESKDGLVGIVHGDLSGITDWYEIQNKLGYEFQQTCIWNRAMFEKSLYADRVDHIKNVSKIYFGHNITPDGLVRRSGNCFFIDSGAILNNALNIIKI